MSKIHPAYGRSSRMDFFEPHVLANILKRKIIVRDLSENCDFVTNFEPYPAIDREKLRHRVKTDGQKTEKSFKLWPGVQVIENPVQNSVITTMMHCYLRVESEDEPQNGIWEKAPKKKQSTE
jgi:hypothetical protein